MPKHPGDLIAFTAVLITAAVMVIAGHLTPVALCTFAAGVAGLYAAWRPPKIRQ